MSEFADRQRSFERRVDAEPSVFTYEGEFREHLNKVQRIMEIPEEQRQAIHNTLDETAQRVSSLVQDESLRPQVQVMANIMKWHLAGRAHEPLPEGLIVVDESLDRDAQRLDVKVFSASPETKGISNLAQALEDADVSRATSIANSVLRHRKPELRSALQEYAEDSVVSRFVASFEHESPGIQTAPLLPYWQQVRQSDIEHEVRTKYGMQHHEQFAKGTDAARELGRKKLHLSEETMPQQLQAEQEPIARFKSIAVNELEEFIRYENGDDGMSDFTLVSELLDGKYYTVAQFKTKAFDEEHKVVVDDYIYDLSESLGEKIGLDMSNPLVDVDKNILRELLREVLSPTFAYSNLQLERLLKYAQEDATRNVISEMFDRKSELGWFTGSAKLRESAHSQAVSWNSYQNQIDLLDTHTNRWSDEFNLREPHLYCHADLQLYKQLKIGLVEHAYQNFDPVSLRLLLAQSQDSSAAIPSHAPLDYDVKLQFNSVNSAPKRLPGYITTGYCETEFGREYYYSRDPNGDPYAHCDVQIDNSNLQKLSEFLYAAGMDMNDPLVTQDERGATVSNVVRYIQQRSDYVFADDPSAKKAHKSFRHPWKQFDSPLNRYPQLMKDGRLQVQCTGAARFLSDALNATFGAGHARVIEGLVMNSSESTISLAGHAQVLFVYGGREYILDSTPLVSGGSAYGDNENYAVYTNDTVTGPVQPYTPPKPVASENQIQNVESLLEAAEPIKKTDDERAQEAIETLTYSLRTIMDSSTNDELYEALLSRPDGDPMRRTLQLIMASEQGNTLTYSAAGLADYLEACQNAPIEVRRRTGIDHYQPEILTLLARSLANYRQIRGL